MTLRSAAPCGNAQFGLRGIGEFGGASLSGSRFYTGQSLLRTPQSETASESSKDVVSFFFSFEFSYLERLSTPNLDAGSNQSLRCS
jgi:hypothetical protein